MEALQCSAVGEDLRCRGVIRVCHLTSVHAAEDVRIFGKECCGLAEAGYEAHLVAPATKSYSKRGVNIHGVLPTRAGRFRRMLVTGWKVYNQAKALQADIYHLHDPELLPYGLALRAAGRLVIYDAHEDVPRDIESKHWIPMWMRRPISYISERFENIAARRLSAIVAATPYIGKRFEQINPNTVTINNYPVSGDLDHGGSSTGFSSDERPYVCYAGGISAIRGVREMITAMSRTDVRMLLAGRFDTEKLHNEIKQLPGWDRVEFLGQLARAELASALKRCFIGLVLFHPETNHLHAQPNKIFEYMSAGLPLVVSDFPLWRELVEDTGCGICVNPLDVKAVAEAIETLNNNRERARAMGESGLRAVRQKYNWEREQSALIHLYGRLIDG